MPEVGEIKVNALTGGRYAWTGSYWRVAPDGQKDYSCLVSVEQFEEDQQRQDDVFAKDQQRQDDAFAKGQALQDDAFAKGQARQDERIDWLIAKGEKGFAEDQQRQDDAFAKGQAEQDADRSRVEDESKARDLLIEAEVLALSATFAKGQSAQDDVFAKGQAAQDDAFAKGQARQDKALQDEIDARAERDLTHDAQLSTLEYKVDALVGLQFRGAYRFKHDVNCDAAYQACMAAAGGDVQAGQACGRDLVACEIDKVPAGVFEAVDPDDRFDHLLSIVVHMTDLSGVEIEWGNVLDAGDYVEIDHQIGGVADKTNYGLYRIIEEPEIKQNAQGEDVYSFQLEFLQGEGEMLEDEIYEIRGINKDTGVNPEELADFLTKEDAQKTYLPLIGGTLTGTLKMKDANVIETRHLDSGQNTDLQIKRDGQRRILVGTEKIVFDKPPECGAPIKGTNQLVTKAYVDANKGSGPKGNKGDVGSGEKGDKGRRGATGTGTTGAKGNRGAKGARGSSASVGNTYIHSTNSQNIGIYKSGGVYYITGG